MAGAIDAISAANPARPSDKSSTTPSRSDNPLPDSSALFLFLYALLRAYCIIASAISCSRFVMKFDLLIHQGATYSQKIPMKRDYRNYSARMQARIHPSSTDVLFEISPSVSDEFIVINIDSETTNKFDWGSAVYDIELTAPDGSVTFPVYGVINVRKRITR